MATIKFSEFNAGNINVAGAQLVGLTGGNTATNARFTAADLVNGLATVTYVDAQDAGLQSQITQNTNDIANIDLSGLQSNVSTLQGQVSVLQGNIVVLDSAVAALENNVTVNSDDIAVLQGNVIQIENDLANINTDSQTLSWDGATANLAISNGNNVVLQEVLDNTGNIASAQSDIQNLVLNQNAIALNVSNNSSNITVIQGQIADLQANGNIQTLSLDNSSNILSISGGNTVDFTTVLGNVAGGGGGLAAVVDDTSPQLGGTLNSNGFNIELSSGSPLEFGIEWNDGSGTKYGDIVAQPDSNEFEISSGSGARDLVLVGDRDIEIKTGLLGRDIIIGDLIWPSADGSAGQVLQTDGAGNLSFGAGGGGGGSYGNANVTAYAEAGWAGNIIPSANITYDLGTPTNRWKDLYLSNATIYLGDSTISGANGSLAVDGQVLENTFSTSTPVLNTNTDVYANNGVGNPTGAPLPSPDKKNGWYWISPGGSGTDRSIQWRLYNNAGPQDFAVEDIEYMYMVVDLKALGDVYFNIYTMDAFPNVPSSFNKRFSFALNGSHSSTGTYLLWAKPPGSSTTVEQIAVYQQFPRIELPFQSAFSTGTIADVGETIKNIAVTTSTSVGAGDVEFTLKTTGYKVSQGLIQDFNPVVGNPFDQDLSTTDNVEFAQVSIANTTVTSNATTSSMDVQFDSKPPAKITSGVMVQVHGSWDASAGAAFNWGNDEIASHGISNVTRTNTGIFTVEFETPFASNAYTATFGVGSTDYSGGGASPREVSLLTRNAGNCTVICERSDDAVNEDNFYMSLMICGII